jgi:hypothetical protein
LAVLSHGFQNSSAHAALLGVWDAEVQPALRARPGRRARAASQDHRGRQPLPQKFTKGEMADLDKQLVAGLVLVTTREAFAWPRG